MVTIVPVLTLILTGVKRFSFAYFLSFGRNIYKNYQTYMSCMFALMFPWKVCWFSYQENKAFACWTRGNPFVRLVINSAIRVMNSTYYRSDSEGQSSCYTHSLPIILFASERMCFRALDMQMAVLQRALEPNWELFFLHLTASHAGVASNDFQNFVVCGLPFM